MHPIHKAYKKYSKCNKCKEMKQEVLVNGYTILDLCGRCEEVKWTKKE